MHDSTIPGVRILVSRISVDKRWRHRTEMESRQETFNPWSSFRKRFWGEVARHWVTLWVTHWKGLGRLGWLQPCFPIYGLRIVEILKILPVKCQRRKPWQIEKYHQSEPLRSFLALSEEVRAAKIWYMASIIQQFAANRPRGKIQSLLPWMEKERPSSVNVGIYRYDKRWGGLPSVALSLTLDVYV